MDAVGARDADRDPVGWRFEATYAGLPGDLFEETGAAPAPEPKVVFLNHGLARELGLDLAGLDSGTAAALFAGQAVPAGARPIAQAYAGHQFGGFTMLGDGRALLVGEHRTPDGRLVDVQLKGSGRTRFSRGGDGRAALGPMLRELIVSEAMAALGIPTTRSLAVVTTGQPVYRETLKRGAVLTRVAASHLRVGTFEYAVRRSPATLRALADYAIARHDPALAGEPDRYRGFLAAVIERQAALVARWQLVGFIHGVMNTDNVAVSGETIDYGPCAFLNAYDPAQVYSSIDRGGRYAYGNQPNILHWNLARFAETLLPLLDPEPDPAIAIAIEALDAYPAAFERHRQAGLRRKLGLTTEAPDDPELFQTLLDWMQRTRADFTNTFRALATEDVLAGEPGRDPEFRAWHERWCRRLGRAEGPDEAARALMQSASPAVIPRNHQVEAALAAAEDRDDLTVLQRLLEALATPYESRPEHAEYRDPPADECGYRTFCGT